MGVQEYGYMKHYSYGSSICIELTCKLLCKHNMY